MSKKKITRAEIWVGGMSNPAYCFPVKESTHCVESDTVHLVAEDGTEFAVSPHNLVLISYYETEKDNKPRTETEAEKTFFTPEEVRRMSRSEVRKKYKEIMRSMSKWK